MEKYESSFVRGMKEIGRKNPEKAFNLVIERLIRIEDAYRIQRQVIKKLLAKNGLKYSDLIDAKFKDDYKTLNPNDKKLFFKSSLWKNLRYKLLTERERKCALCGTRNPESSWHIDHIRPISLYPELATDQNNLQILCEDCNLGKSDTMPHKIIKIRKNGCIETNLDVAKEINK